jgi:hypothetical protein
LKIEKGIEVQGTGSLTFENNASLHRMKVINTGTITKEKRRQLINLIIPIGHLLRIKHYWLYHTAG